MLSTLFIDGRSLTELRIYQSFLAYIASLQSLPLEPGLQAATMSAWLLCGFQDLNSDPYICAGSVYTLNHLPRLCCVFQDFFLP